MDDRDCAKCQKSRKMTHWELLELLMRMRQNCNSVIFSILKTKNVQWLERNGQWLDFLFFRERRSSFSLDFWPFGPSVLDGARSKVDLCGEGYTWTPIWWSSDNSKR